MSADGTDHPHEPPPTLAEYDALIARVEAGEPSLLPLAILRGIRADVERAEVVRMYDNDPRDVAEGRAEAAALDAEIASLAGTEDDDD